MLNVSNISDMHVKYVKEKQQGDAGVNPAGEKLITVKVQRRDTQVVTKLV